MSAQPKISVVLPVRDEEELLPGTLESLLRQSEPDFEVIAVDDGSSDGTAGILAGFAARDQRIKPAAQDRAGIVTALNRGLAEARGALIARIDADDIAHPDRLRLQAGFLDRAPETGLVASRVEYLGDARKNAGLAHFVDWTNTLTSPERISLYRFVESPIIHPSVMFRRELAGQYGDYRDGPFPEDYELWLRWMEKGVRMAKLDETLTQWRDRPGRLTRTDSRYSVEAFYRTKAPYLHRWLERHNPRHPSVTVWGSGRASRQRLKFLTDLGVRVEAFVDIDPRKIGYQIGGADVIWPDALPGPGNCFVLSWVASRGARDEIEEELGQRGFRLGEHYLPCA